MTKYPVLGQVWPTATNREVNRTVQHELLYYFRHLLAFQEDDKLFFFKRPNGIFCCTARPPCLKGQRWTHKWRIVVDSNSGAGVSQQQQRLLPFVIIYCTYVRVLFQHPHVWLIHIFLRSMGQPITKPLAELDVSQGHIPIFSKLFHILHVLPTQKLG